MRLAVWLLVVALAALTFSTFAKAESYERLLQKLQRRHVYYDFGKDGSLVKETMSAWPSIATYYNGPFPVRKDLEEAWYKQARFNAQGFMLHIGADNEAHAVLVVRAVHELLKHYSLLANWKFVSAKELSLVWTPKSSLVGKLVTIYPRTDSVLTTITGKLLALFQKVKSKVPASIQRSCVDPILGDLKSPLSIRYGVFKQFAPTPCLVKVNQDGQCLDKSGDIISECSSSGAVQMEVIDQFSPFWKPKWVKWNPFGGVPIPVFLPSRLPECQCSNCDRGEDEDVYSTYSPIMPN